MIEQIILFVVPICTIIFALGEQFSWWDSLTGRSKALEEKNRLYSAEGYPRTWIYRNREDDVKVFRA
jgi:hypothetical protein